MDETAMGRLSVATMCDLILSHAHPEQRTRIVQDALDDLDIGDALRAQGQIISMLCDALDSLGKTSSEVRAHMDRFVAGVQLELQTLDGIPEDARGEDRPAR